MDRLERKRRRAEILKDYDSITRKIAEHSNLGGAELVQLKGGYVNVVLLATKGNTRRVIKIFADDSLRNELYWYDKAEKAKIGEPRSLSYSLSKKVVPYEYLIADYISASPLDWKSKKLLYDAGLFAGRSLRKLHKIRVDGFGHIKPNGKWSSKTWAGALMERRRFAINDEAALKILKPRQVERIDDLTVYNKGLDFKDPRLLHGDLYEENVLHSEARNKFFIIDPSSFMIGGDPMYDVSFSLVERSGSFHKGFKEGYIVDELTEKEQYRLKMLSIFQVFTELTWYVGNKGPEWAIKRYNRQLLEKLSDA